MSATSRYILFVRVALRRTVFGLALGFGLGAGRSARAGGFDLPDNGTEAVGRGTAFVAKADSPLAMYYNPAGLARQRGTRLLVDGNIFIHSFTFQRLGVFPDDPQTADTPWGNAPFPAVTNTAGPFFSPFIGLASDFGYFDRATFAVGFMTPPMIANRTFPLGVDKRPSASRYDYVQSRTQFLMPTASAGIRVTRWLDLGMSAHLVLGKIDQTSIIYADSGGEDCAGAPEYFKCDSRSTLAASGTSFGATFGALVRPAPSYAFGLSVRTPVNLTAIGTVTPDQPQAKNAETDTGAASYGVQLPVLVKAGGRYIGMDQDYELYDLELNVTYEMWGVSQKVGPIVTIPEAGDFKDIQYPILHGYGNTFGIRAGGAYNIDMGGDSQFILRGGAFYDGSATDFSTTRLDVDTLAKIGGTLGFGYRYGGFTFNFGYAAVASIPRTVGSNPGGLIQPINGLDGGSTLDAQGEPMGVVNEGAYRGFTHIVSLGATITFDAFVGKPRPVMYGNPWEPNYAGPRDDDEPKKPEEKKPEEKKPEETKAEEKKLEETKKPPPEVKRPPPEEPKKPPPKKPPPPEEEEEEEEEEEPPPPPKKGAGKKLPAPEEPPPPPPKKPDPPPEVKPPPPPPPPKPPSKRKEWWEDPD